MELVGKIVSYDRQSKSCQFVFRCTNKETVTIKQAPIVPNLPENTLLRIFTIRPDLPNGTLSRENILVQWERLDIDDDKIHVIEYKRGAQKVLTFSKDEIQ